MTKIDQKPSIFLDALSCDERELVYLVGHGMPMEDACEEIGIQPTTGYNWRSRMVRKTGANDFYHVVACVARASQRQALEDAGLLDPVASNKPQPKPSVTCRRTPRMRVDGEAKNEKRRARK